MTPSIPWLFTVYQEQIGLIASDGDEAFIAVVQRPKLTTTLIPNGPAGTPESEVQLTDDLPSISAKLFIQI